MALSFKEFAKRLITGIILLVSFGGSYLHSPHLFIFSLSIILLITLTQEWNTLVTLSKPSRALFTIIYPVFPVATLMWLTYTFHQTDFYLPLFPFITAWTADTMGYAIGKLFGKHKMCPSISPGKSWEGFAGSTVGVLIAYLWFLPKINLFNSQLLSPLKNNIIFMAIFALVMTTIAFLGGLFLSVLKRRKDKKDAGDMLPGHGGFLDRFDAVFFVAVATLVLIFGS